MKVHSTFIEMVDAGTSQGNAHGATSFEPPEGAVDVTKGVAVVGNVPCLVVTWIELTNEERTAIMRQQAQRQGGVLLP